jgi:hypothetical protein
MATTYTSLGPDGTVGTIGGLADLMRNSGGDQAEALNALAANIRSGLATATKSPEFQQVDPATGKSYAETFGENIVKYSVSPLLSDDEREAFEKDFQITAGDGGSILTFLMLDHGYSDDFVLGAADKLDSFEKLAKDSIMPADVWYSHNGYSPLEGNGDGGYADDPMAAIMGNLGAHPAAGLEFFTEDPNRQKFYFNDRTWKADGYEGISEAAEGISTDLDNLRKHPDGTTKLAATFVDYISNADGFNAEDAKAASPYIAKLLKFYMPAVDASLHSGRTEQDGHDLTPGNGPFDQAYFGHFDHYPEFFKNDMESLTTVGMSTADGMQSIAEGVGGYQGTRLNNMAVVLGQDPENFKKGNELKDIIQSGAALRGFMEHAVGETEIDGAKDQDAQRQAFIDIVSDVVGEVPIPGADALGDAGSKVVEFGWSKAMSAGTDAASSHFANQTEGATSDANTRASDGANEVKIETYLSLVRAGVIPYSELDPAFKDGYGNLKKFSDIKASDVPNDVRVAMSKVDDYATNFDIEGAYKNSFLAYYN